MTLADIYHPGISSKYISEYESEKFKYDMNKQYFDMLKSIRATHRYGEKISDDEIEAFLDERGDTLDDMFNSYLRTTCKRIPRYNLIMFSIYLSIIIFVILAAIFGKTLFIEGLFIYLGIYIAALLVDLYFIYKTRRVKKASRDLTRETLDLDLELDLDLNLDWI